MGIGAGNGVFSNLQTSFLIDVLCCLDGPLSSVWVWKTISLLLLSLQPYTFAVMAQSLVKTARGQVEDETQPSKRNRPGISLVPCVAQTQCIGAS